MFPKQNNSRLQLVQKVGKSQNLMGTNNSTGINPSACCFFNYRLIIIGKFSLDNKQYDH